MPFIAGHYTNTFNASSIGDSKEGFRIKETHNKEDVITDALGDVPADGINRGTSCEVTLDYVEYDLIEPALYTFNSIGDAKGNIGKTLVSLAKPLVLTPVAGTPAAALHGPYTFSKAIIATDIETLLANKLRSGPITFKIYPDPSTGKNYTVATPS